MITTKNFRYQCGIFVPFKVPVVQCTRVETLVSIYSHNFQPLDRVAYATLAVNYAALRYSCGY